MSKQLLYYENVVPVSAERHKDRYLKALRKYEFARTSVSVPLTAVEIPAAAAEYAVVFTGDENAIVPVALFGVEQDKNLFVDEEGAWQARYVPAFVRRYPFVFSKVGEDGRFLLCVDEAYEGFNTEGRGERLFDVDGNRTQYLGTVLSFVEEYQRQFQRTQVFCQKLLELDLLEPVHAQFNLPSGKRGALTGFRVVSREKLKEVPDKELLELFRTDELELIYVHMHSVRNLSRMLELAGIQSDHGEDEVEMAAKDGLTDAEA